MTTLFDLTHKTLAATPATGPRPLVIGIDASLNSLGIAGADWADAIRHPGLTGHARIDYLRREVADRTKAADLVVIEDVARGAKGSAVHQLAGLWWVLTTELHRRGIPFAVANPQSRYTYATGVANPAREHPRDKRARICKGMVCSFVNEQLGIWCEGPGKYDAADAAVFAAMGLDWLGYPLIDLPPQQRRALDGVHWPTQTVAVAR
ncbi:hypothetical protein [Streptomyces dubilierae]|uniref:Uncharacterized protein n=1 Tax=Streptomyces dubilierae TaxID=3075533 RepID=A0ABU2PAQ7_9ACTN|nr:hypothetical protein [Streptomyces sp. DSM 41921]MDT0387870.1 hypothetical protein [Streptomyces sp. DSM 41921]